MDQTSSQAKKVKTKRPCYKEYSFEISYMEAYITIIVYKFLTRLKF